jgi:hypothetical protein
VDESTDIDDTAVFSVFVCGYNHDFVTIEELTKLICVHGIPAGDVFCEVGSLV